MTHLAAAVTMADPPRTGAREIGLWTAAAVLAVGAHVVIAYAVQSFCLANETDGGPPPAMAIELSPLAPAVQEDSMPDVVTPEPPNQVEETEADIEPAPKPVVEPAPEAEADQAEPVAEKPETVLPDETAPAEMTEQLEQPPLDEVVPEIVQTVAPDVIIPLPQPKPKDDNPVEERTAGMAKKPVEKPGQRPKKDKKEKAARAKAVMTASVDAKPAAKATTPKASQTGSRSGDANRWSASLRSWIKRRTHYPSTARPRGAEGTVNVSFVVDASGRVTSARLARSSGDADLDRAALSVLQGATVPTPPPDKVGAVVAPIVFSLRD
ncbi:TonB family protein [Mesorhizobium sp. ArgA1]